MMIIIYYYHLLSFMSILIITLLYNACFIIIIMMLVLYMWETNAINLQSWRACATHFWRVMIIPQGSYSKLDRKLGSLFETHNDNLVIEWWSLIKG